MADILVADPLAALKMAEQLQERLHAWLPELLEHLDPSKHPKTKEEGDALMAWVFTGILIGYARNANYDDERIRALVDRVLAAKIVMKGAVDA
jgi:hypothetical protein